MDDTDSFITAAAVVAAIVLWWSWFRRAANIFAPRCPLPWRLAVMALPPLLVISLVTTLHYVAAPDVKDNSGYLTLFSAVGTLSLYGASFFSSLAGLDPLANGIEGGNRAAILSVAGLWSATTVLNIGANIGSGEDISTTLIPLAIGLGLLGLFLAVVSWSTDLLPAIASARRTAAGVRLGALALSASLPLANAASGDWISLPATLGDMISVTPQLVLLVGAAWVVERVWPSAELRSFASILTRAVAPSLGFLALAAGLTWKIGGN